MTTSSCGLLGTRRYKLCRLINVEEEGVSLHPFSEMSCALEKESCSSEEVPVYL